LYCLFIYNVLLTGFDYHFVYYLQTFLDPGYNEILIVFDTIPYHIDTDFREIEMVIYIALPPRNYFDKLCSTFRVIYDAGKVKCELKRRIKIKE
jgi:hypothetical protein